MGMPSVLVLSLVLLFSSASQPVRHFVRISTGQFPRTVVEQDFCRNKDLDCWQNFLIQGSVWAADINGDGSKELLIFPGYGWRGSGGSWYFLYEKRGKDWVSLTKDPDNLQEENGWFTLDARFDLLPAVRHRYHDLRVAAGLCMKWDGRKYVEYDPADYHHPESRLVQPGRQS
jgi:hypothetical protein